MMHGKEKTPLFGGSISPDCLYCVFGGADISCKLGLQLRPDGTCKRFTYDPLRRVPKKDPLLPDYSSEDFRL